jgi:hypothetical protein
MGNAVDSPTLESQQGRGRLISLVMPVHSQEANLDRADAALTAVFGKLPKADLHVTLNYGFRCTLLTACRNASAAIRID